MLIELRQYTLRPGQRDVLIDLFDGHFVEGQEDVGMKIIGQFSETRNAERFVWLRGFAGFIAFFEHELARLATSQGAAIEAYLLPLRLNENVFAWFALFPDRAAYERHAAALATSAEWQRAMSNRVLLRAAKPAEVRLLAPTARSQLR